MTRQQPPERRRRTPKVQPLRDREGAGTRRQGHPILALHKTVGNACIARMLAPTTSATVQRAAIARYADVAGEALDAEHTEWINLSLADATNGSTKSRDSSTGKDAHTWAHALGLTEWEL